MSAIGLPDFARQDGVKCQQEVKFTEERTRRSMSRAIPSSSASPSSPHWCRMVVRKLTTPDWFYCSRSTRTLLGWMLLCKSPESLGLRYSQIQDSGMPVSPLRLISLLRYGSTGDIGTKSVIGHCWVFLVDRLGRQKISPFFASLITFIVFPVHETLNSASTISNRLLDYIVTLWLQRMTAVETLGV